jgi:hypothetical protein
MNIEIKSKVSGKITWLEVRDKNGKLKTRVEDVPNIILNGGMNSGGFLTGPSGSHATYASTLESYEDLGGTWNQTGNTITRATGAGIFPSSPSHVGNELRWGTGERVHVTARASDTSITVSGPARSITGGTLRRYLVNGGAYFGSSIQTSSSVTLLSQVTDQTANTHVRTYRANYTSATSGYTLGSIILAGCARVKLPEPITIDVDDQLLYEYTVTETVSGRSQIYELGAESVGIPQKHSMLSIVGNGTNVDVTFSAATHFLAGDKLDLRGVVTKKVAISSASSTSTTLTINTATAHSLNPGDSVTIENASLAGYNGVFTVATTPTGTQLTITDAANPGAMGASGTARLTNPGGYFNTLGLATIASMVSSSVARITSAITGAAVEPVPIGGDPGVTVKFVSQNANQELRLAFGGVSHVFTEANANPIGDTTTTGIISSTNTLWGFDSLASTNAAFGNDWTWSGTLTKNAGAGTNGTRIKQFYTRAGTSGCAAQVTFNTPFDKTTAQRLRWGASKQVLRDLP